MPSASIITSQYFPFPQGAYEFGGVSTVHSDGSAGVAIAFPFISFLLNQTLSYSVVTADGVDREISVQFKDLTQTGATIWAYGGLPTETVTVNWSVAGA